MRLLKLSGTQKDREEHPIQLATLSMNLHNTVKKINTHSLNN